MSENSVEFKRLAKRLARIEQAQANMSKPQLAYSSIENGNVKSYEGNDLKMIVGMQDDGGQTTTVFNGPTPPTPVGFTVDVDHGKFITHWQGGFDGDALAPSDWSRAEVHASQDPFFVPSRATARGSIVSAAGGEVTIGVLKGSWTIKMVAWSQAGKMSVPSAPVDVEVPGYGDIVLEEIDAAQTRIDNARAILIEGQETLGTKLDEADTALASLRDSLDNLDETTLPALRQDLDAAEGRLDSAEGQITDAFGELDLVPGQIADAKQAAIDAAALDATGKADAAQSAAEAVAATAQQAADDALAAINAGESMWADPGFESSFGPLGSTNPSIVRSNVFAYQGSWSVEYTTTGNGANVYPGYVSVPVTAGRTYRLSAAVRSDDGLAFESFFEQRSGGSTVVSAPRLEIAGGVGSFALGDATQTIVDGVSELRFAPMVPAAHNNTAGKKLYLDNFTLTDITESWAMFQEAMTAASDAQTVAGEAKAIAEAAVGAAEGGNTNFFNQSEPSGVGSLVGDRWFQRTATWAITGMWMWDGSNWIRQTLNNEVIGNLDAGKITFGSMNGERIEAGSIYADRIVSGLSQNMVPDPGFVSPEINASRLLNNSSFGGTWGIAGGVLSCDTNGGTMTNNSNFPLAATSDREAWSAYPGMTMVHRFSARVVGGSATVRGTAYTLRRDGTKAYTALTPSAFIPITGAWQEYSFSTALGDDITSYSTALQVGRTSTGVVEFKAPFSASMVGTTVIEGGAVTTNKLAANVLEVGNLKAGTAAIAEAVVQKIAAQTASIQTADIKNLFVTGTASLSDVVAERIAAETAEFIELEVGNLVAGTGTMDEATINKLFADVVVAGMSIATEFIGENAILTGAVTAPKITASEELWAKIGEFVQIRAEQIEADAIDGMVITGPNIRTSATGARVQMDVGGLRVFDASDDQMVQLPSDGTAATFNGELVAKSLTSTGRASFLAENNRLEPGAGLVLAAGVGDPPSPPVVSNHYTQITPPALVDGESVSGLAYGDGLFWRAVDAGSGNNPLDRIEGIDRDGVIQRTIPLVNFWARNGLAVVGDELFALGIRDDRPVNVRNHERWVRVYGLDGTYKRQWEYLNYGTGTYQPGIGSTPAGNVSIAQCWVDGKLSWRTFSPTGTFINITTRDAPVKSDAVGIYGGTADFGATRTVFAKGFTPGTNRQFTVYGTNGNDYFPEQSWYSPDRGDVRGLAWDGAKFYSIDPAGVITEYGSLNMGDDSANWWATYRWVGSGSKTTRIAPPGRFAWARRSRLRVSAPNLPQGVTTIEPSLAFKTTIPVRTEFRSPAWVAGATPATVNYEELPTSWQTGAAPGDINNFPNSTPSNVKAASGLFEVKGDGSGRWGPLTFNPDGTMTSSAVPAWVPITAFASGFSVQSWGFAPAYRVWPDGKVEWRGVVAGNFSGTGTPTPFVIPSAARPSQPVNTIAGCNIVNGGSEGHIRVEFSAADRPTQLSVYPAGKARTWFALDNITYYKN